MDINALPSERAGLVGAIDPDAYGTGTETTGWIDAKDFFTFLALVSVGTLGSSATVDAKLEQAKDSSGTDAKDISGKSITQLTQAGTDSDKQALINLRQEELDVQNGFTHFRLSITVGTAASDAAGFVFGMDPRLGTAADNDASSVDEIVA